MNAALAIAALQATDIQVSDDAIARGLSSVEWPARFQIWNERIVIDGAHNPAGARILAQTWREEFGNERATIFARNLARQKCCGNRSRLGTNRDKICAPTNSQRARPAPE
jgi:Folylpolyglutamate synthase